MEKKKDQKELVDVFEYNSRTLTLWQEKLNEIQSGAVAILGYNKLTGSLCFFAGALFPKDDLALALRKLADDLDSGQNVFVHDPQKGKPN